MNKKEQQSIDFLRSMEREEPLSLGFSGGKDSVGCPLCNYKQMQLEFKMFPGYARRIIVAVERYMNTHPNVFLSRNFEDGYEAFFYYINEIPIAEFHKQKQEFPRFSAKEIIQREILNQKE